MDRSVLVAGLSAVAPAMVSSVSFGMLYGATATQSGMEPEAVVALSIIAFAAVAQLAIVELLQLGAPLPIILLTVGLINFRYLIFSATLAPKVRHLSRRWRAVIAYPLMDVTYALASTQFDETDPHDGHRGWYYLVVSVPFVGSFVLGSTIGALAGQSLADGLHLDFFLPLVFISLLVPQLKDKPAALTAIGAALVAVVGVNIPFNLGLPVAILSGALVGAILDADWGGGLH